ncbi:MULTISPECIES: hypothetical protein [unclassified Knoellia]|uniref:hypothetical protein n=1 Tax=Knoellia altitudinis TaxID=3404795 RepID=UPI00361BF20F
MSSLIRSTVAALLLAGPVAIQLVAPQLGESRAGNVLFAVSQVLGWLLLATVCRALAPALPGRAGRVGRRLLVAGTLSEVAFALAYGTLVLVGADEGSAFLLFALGFLLLTVGGITSGVVAIRRGWKALGVSLAGVVVLGLLANVVGDTWWHDLFLLTHYVGWVVVGRFVPSVPAERGMPSAQGARTAYRTVRG